MEGEGNGIIYVDTLEIRVGRTNELSTPGESFTYFKQNCQNSQQVYMTVKKATPLKNTDSTNFDLIPRTDHLFSHILFFLFPSLSLFYFDKHQVRKLTYVSIFCFFLFSISLRIRR